MPSCQIAYSIPAKRRARATTATLRPRRPAMRSARVRSGAASGLFDGVLFDRFSCDSARTGEGASTPRSPPLGLGDQYYARAFREETGITFYHAARERTAQ